jgi:threonine dehydratase
MEKTVTVTLDDIRAANATITPWVSETPLIELEPEGASAPIFLKMENLSPTGSFKLRGALNAIEHYCRAQDTPVWTVSAGNMGKALAFAAHRKGIPCSVVVPDDIPAKKRVGIERYGALVIPAPFADYQAMQINHHCRGVEGQLVHPFDDEYVMAGNGTIGLEILARCPDVEAVYVPFGGGGLVSGIATAVKGIRPRVKIIACEVETAAPLTASHRAGMPVEVPYTSTFISGIGAPFVFPQMWERVESLIDDVIPVSLQEAASAMRMILEATCTVVEGAGAVALAAALQDPHRCERSVCIVSGGNIDVRQFADIIQSELA